MKQELPIAICLLAAGASIWTLNRPAPTHGHQPNKLTAVALQELQGVPNTETSERNSRTEPAIPITNRLIAKPRASVKGKLTVRDFHSENDKTAATKLLAETFDAIQQSPPFQSHVQVQATLFNQTVVGEGTYYQLGQSRGHSRIDLNLSAGHKQHQLTQLCDGRFVYRLNRDTATGKRELKFYDLQQLQQQRQQSLQPGATGSSSGNDLFSGVNLPGLIDHLRLSFDFFMVPQQADKQADQRLLRGIWKAAPLQRLISDLFDAETIQNGVAWNELPRQLPHAVELSLQQQDDGSWFPRDIVFYHFQTLSRSSLAEPIVAIGYSERVLKPDLPADLFVMNAVELEASDVTPQYLSRLRGQDLASDSNDSDLRR